MLGFVAAVAVATILAVVSALTLSTSSTIAHDFYVNWVKGGRVEGRHEVWIARATAVVIGLLAIALGILAQGVNVAVLVILAICVAASANFPVLILSLFWRRFNTGGVIGGMTVGLVSSVVLAMIGPAMRGSRLCGLWSIPRSCPCRLDSWEPWLAPCSPGAIWKTKSASTRFCCRSTPGSRPNNSSHQGTASVTVKAIVFDAYGTLYDIQSVANITDEAFPGYGELITQIWRIKQLEYTWLRSLMRRYEDFSVITRDSLTYTLKILGLAYDDGIFEKIMDKYVHLDLYPDAKAALLSLKNYKRAILSNGSTDMLTALVRNTGLDSILDATISIDAKGIFKPSPDAYSLIQARLDVNPGDVLFVSSNPWDAIGAKAVGLKVAWIERVTQEAMADACQKCDLVAPLTMFKALRMQMDELGMAPDYKVNGLSALPDILSESKN